MSIKSNLPSKEIQDSAAGTRLYFDNYGESPLEFGSNEVAAATGFFTSRGFDNDAALQTAAILLKQAKIDQAPVFKILETLKEFDGLQLSALVAEILNNNRPVTSSLGYRFLDLGKQNQSRNIAA
jgi:hypothetical protein